MASAEKRILIINPDRAERAIMAFFLKNEKFDVETGTGLADAVKKIREGDFGCLILDVNLPEMKGYEVVPILKRIAPEIKIIMTAKKNTKSLEAKIRAQDIFFYYIKSFSKDELIMALNSAFRN